jgi:uncharacterized membrane protein
MSYKQFMLVRILVVIVVAGLVAWAVTDGRPMVPVPAAIAGATILLLLRRRVKEVVIDERISSIADKAAQKAFRIFGILAAVIGATLVALSREGSPAFLYIGLTLAYATYGLVILYYVFYNYYNRKLGGKE